MRRRHPNGKGCQHAQLTLGLLTAVTLALAACSSSQHAGSSSSSSESSTATGPTTSAHSTTSDAAAGLVPEKLKSKGVLSIAMDPTYPPYESIAADGHTIVGWEADLGKALSATLGLKADEKNVKFDTIIPGLVDGKYDMGLSAFVDTKAREKVVDFVTYFRGGDEFYVKAGSGKSYDGLDALCGTKVSVENGTTEQTEAQNQAKKCAAEGKPAVTILTFGDQNGANLAVSSGRADLGFADSAVVGYLVDQSHGQFAKTGHIFGATPFGIALPKDNGMAKAVQAGLKTLIDNGEYLKILTKWGVQDGAITTPMINDAATGATS